MPDLIFPLPCPPKNRFWERNQTSFGWDRTNPDKSHRKHAGVDLEANVGTPVLAMTDGTVLRVAGFYQGTWAIEVQHPGFGIVRYSEVSALILAVEDREVKRGATIGFVGQRVAAKRAMLHLELYTDWENSDTRPGDGRHPLSNDSAPYQRRADLKDPTNLLWGILNPAWSGSPRETEAKTQLINVLRQAPIVNLCSERAAKP